MADNDQRAYSVGPVAYGGGPNAYGPKANDWTARLPRPSKAIDPSMTKNPSGVGEDFIEQQAPGGFQYPGLYDPRGQQNI